MVRLENSFDYNGPDSACPTVFAIPTLDLPLLLPFGHRTVRAHAIQSDLVVQVKLEAEEGMSVEWDARHL